MTYTVIGVWANDSAVAAAVVEGTVKLVDTFVPENDGDFGRWAEVVEATTPDEAEAMAIASIEAQERGVTRPMMIELDDSEHATVLAALRVYQRLGYGDPASRPEDIHDIATNAGEAVSLDDTGIDTLCERLNGR